MSRLKRGRAPLDVQIETRWLAVGYHFVREALIRAVEHERVDDDPAEDDDWRKHQRMDFIGDRVEAVIASIDTCARDAR